MIRSETGESCGLLEPPTKNHHAEVIPILVGKRVGSDPHMDGKNNRPTRLNVGVMPSPPVGNGEPGNGVSRPLPRARRRPRNTALP
jgi:hypothetical protein